MGHINNMKKEFGDLAKRLNANVVGLPEPQEQNSWDGWHTILELLYTPQEAAIGAKLPVFPASLEEISRRCGMSQEEIKVLLDQMADKGIVMDLRNPQTQEIFYSLSPPVVGFFELTMMKIGKENVSKKELAMAVSAYAGNSDIFVREVHGSGKTALGRALVYESFLDPDSMPEIYDWEKAVTVIKEAKHIAVSQCYCRHTAEHLGKNCSAPMEVCLSLNEYGEFVIRRNYGRAIDTSEALEILRKSREYGLVHVVDNVKQKPAWMCNCCSCCCGMMKAIRNWGFPAVNPSNFLPYQSQHNCVGCQRCVKKCPVQAITLVRKSDSQPFHQIIIDEERCIGCGVCVSTCNKKALELTRRGNRTFVPEHAVELLIHRAIERGKFAEMLLENGEQWGNPFFNEVLRTIHTLEPQKQQMIKSQLDSRFFDYIL
ncbi:4Fe-4S binding protein [Paenibacillus zanthoxyli]|uniref:4Fe-4S binding protein n=1 Tax=Paenibacillus zanthoxyli TaxID=369399 RepID=UPI00046FAFE6|nr:4Fe-4S binding protein [Paenibacillus zanthoxyli]